MKAGVLLMCHGSPDGIDEIEPFLRRIMGGRAPAPETVADLRERYARIGGRSPLMDITRAQARSLEASLGLPVYVGTRHWRPSIREAAERARSEGIGRLVGIVLAPHYSRAVTGAYQTELEASGMPCAIVREWHMEPALLQYWRGVTSGRDFVIFTAHSIPAEAAGTYPEQVGETARAVAGGPHAVAFQSRGPSPGPWLGPDVHEVLRTLRGRVSVAAIGFVSDNVEIMYDLDVVHRRQAEELGLEWERLPMPNDDPLLIEALASAARRLL